MSVSLIEVIEAGGYDLSTEEDARWLLATQVEYQQLIDKAQELVDAIEAEEYAKAELAYERRMA